MTFKDYFSQQAASYSAYRPHYPQALFDYLTSLCPGRDRAWDCATGNGQGAMSLVPHFKTIIATDASGAQIENAALHPQIDYRVEPAETTTIETRSIDLVTVAQALHWFARDRFYTEVKRVLKPSGIIAVWCYKLPVISEEIDPIIEEYYERIVGEYWPPERQLIEEKYQTIDFPFEEITPPQFQMEVMWTRDRALGYLGTWSATQRFISDRNTNPLQQIYSRFTEAWGDPESIKVARSRIHLRIGKMPSSL
ncbi:methyltransferase domain-containing protein [Lusitaniella coriacea LEGE 07157]|uniref:Methyltransferase domain-containing protein n=1 Tax=Lusitaniella coriacea LEGE 07157 TaxID=945747 RepID=A0A8J7E1H0_9CYAN|nr:class I SAM-dependent methyltransferase [Lusitaniella coriacea]MBE9118816.1 methyltransferase domain-containing protein [Lusitaniella coriacea LEGE 07157]